MLDRESTFAHPQIVQLLKSEFIPVAIDQAYQRRQQDAEGEFYRQIAAQGPRHNFQGTTQGFYIATASGRLLLYNNNRDPDKLLRLVREKLREFQTLPDDARPLAAADKTDPRWNVSPPADGLVVRVHAKVLGGYPPTTDRWQAIFQQALSRDNLWITREESQALAQGEFPSTLLRRVARFHLVDNTRGEPPMWKDDEIRDAQAALDHGVITGRVRLETEDRARGFDCRLRGKLQVVDGRVTRLDLVAAGDFWGAGPFTGNAPPGKFPLAISFTLADGSDIADAVPPQGSRGWVDGYLQLR